MTDYGEPYTRGEVKLLRQMMNENPMRDYLEQRELDLEKRIAGLEALLCDAQQDIEQFKYVLGMVHTTLVAHGKVDVGTDLHKRIMKALEFDAATIAKINS